MSIQHIYACLCGAHTRCEPEELRCGRVFQCPECKDIRAHVYPQGGGRAWIKVQADDVEFYDLLGRRAELEEAHD